MTVWEQQCLARPRSGVGKEAVEARDFESDPSSFQSSDEALPLIRHPEIRPRRNHRVFSAIYICGVLSKVSVPRRSAPVGEQIGSVFSAMLQLQEAEFSERSSYTEQQGQPVDTAPTARVLMGNAAAIAGMTWRGKNF